jgi:hypothetical protein
MQYGNLVPVMSDWEVVIEQIQQIIPRAYRSVVINERTQLLAALNDSANQSRMVLFH